MTGMFTLFDIMFLLVLGLFAVTAVRGIGVWNKNNNSPRLTVPTTVVAKRTNVTDHLRRPATTHYYATFQVDSGDRMELSLGGEEYGMLAEGDRGSLTFQGTRYLGFERA